MPKRTATMAGPAAALDVAAVRSQFPILAQEVNGRPLVYLDSAATAQRPTAVIDAISDFYRTANAAGPQSLNWNAT